VRPTTPCFAAVYAARPGVATIASASTVDYEHIIGFNLTGKGANTVYIGNTRFIRKNRYNNEEFYFLPSIFSNPYKVGIDGNVDEVNAKYKQYLENRIETDIRFRNAFQTLHNKELGCFCQSNICHSHVLLELLQKNHSNNTTSLDISCPSCFCCFI